MGTILAVYSEPERRFFRVANKLRLKPDTVRRTRATPFRYCLDGDDYFLPEAAADIVQSSHLCWARIPSTSLIGLSFEGPLPQLHDFPREPEMSDLDALEVNDIMVGDRHLKRYKESNGRFVPVDSFCSQQLIDSLDENPDALPSISHDAFEGLCAELFVRRGFKVDLFRQSGDGGIDFLALSDGASDPVIFAVQCKQPMEREGKKRNSVGRPVLQQIYGAAKAWDLSGAILISGATYSPAAKKFAELKSTEMEVYSAVDLLRWIEKYRWNEDELP
jgi:HJR/Mrr/RecB family endonuclease